MSLLETGYRTFHDDHPPFPPNAAKKVFIDLIHQPTKEDLKIWPYRFEYRLWITLGPGDLMLNSGSALTGSRLHLCLHIIPIFQFQISGYMILYRPTSQNL